MEEKNCSAENVQSGEKKPKSMFQMQKENWYDKVPLTVKQLDAIIVGGLLALVITFLVIFLDARDIFNPFGY